MTLPPECWNYRHEPQNLGLVRSGNVEPAAIEGQLYLDRNVPAVDKRKDQVAAAGEKTEMTKSRIGLLWAQWMMLGEV